MLTPSLAEDAAPVVAPMILQFFVLAILWVGTLPPTAQRWTEGASWWGAVLLPFLMISTGLLFFSVPLAPLWQPILGPGGMGWSGIPAPVALATVLLLNLGVVGWCVWTSGGMARSPFVPLLLAAPILVGLLGGGTGTTLLTALASGAILMATRGTRGSRGGDGGDGMAAPVTSDPRRGHGGFWVATLVLIGIAAWLRP
jgi:hypothetical protein